MANQAKTPHANALKPWVGEHFTGRRLRERGGNEYTYSNEGLRIASSSEKIEAAVRWAFGSGVQAITPVIENDGKWIEHRVSWYRKGDRLSLTPGHGSHPPVDLVDALGIEQTARNAERCFRCHTTNGEPGVHCQACHGDGTDHVKGPSRTNIRRDASVALCAACHRSPDAVFGSATPELDDERSIRFAPIGLTASRCFKESKSLTCITCHDPHGEPRAKSVDQVCGSCHQVHTTTSRCPRTPGCPSCHMPSGSPIPNLTFTDHRIRIR